MAVKPTRDFSRVGLVLPAPASVANPGTSQNGAVWVGSDTGFYYYDGTSAHRLTEFSPQYFPLYTSGSYYFCNGTSSPTTNAALGNNTLRVTPFVVVKPITITRLGAEFTVAGEANSILRLGIYADGGSGIPSGAPVLDAGSISTGTGNAGTVATGGTPGPYEITVSTVLAAGVWWAAAVVQGAATTQPTVRTMQAASLIFPLPSSAMPSANAAPFGFSIASVSGALPTWSGAATSGAGVRMFFKVA